MAGITTAALQEQLKIMMANQKEYSEQLHIVLHGVNGGDGLVSKLVRLEVELKTLTMRTVENENAIKLGRNIPLEIGKAVAVAVITAAMVLWLHPGAAK